MITVGMVAAKASNSVGRRGTRLFRRRAVAFGVAVLCFLALLAVLAPLLFTTDPAAVHPRLRLLPPGAANWLGTDHLGRDVWSRLIYGSRVSLLVGVSVAVISVVIGSALGVIAGMVRCADEILMRSMDGVMAIPAILFAIAVIGELGANVVTICVAISVPELPRVARLVRSCVLTVRQEAYVDAAISMGTRLPMLIVRHILPNTFGPLTAQAAYVASSAILIESSLSFLGIGLPDDIPSWGNMMADARVYFDLRPGLIAFPGICIALTVLGINRLGAGLRDTVDPRLVRSVTGV